MHVSVGIQTNQREIAIYENTKTKDIRRGSIEKVFNVFFVSRNPK